MLAWDDDTRVRLAAFDWLAVRTRNDANGVVSWEERNAFLCGTRTLPSPFLETGFAG
jgi:hypothetical protein